VTTRDAFEELVGRTIDSALEWYSTSTQHQQHGVPVTEAIAQDASAAADAAYDALLAAWDAQAEELRAAKAALAERDEAARDRPVERDWWDRE